MFTFLWCPSNAPVPAEGGHRDDFIGFFGTRSRGEMRRQDLERLQVPYSPEEAATRGAFAARVGARIDEVRELHDAVFDDLDGTTFGIGWWTSMPTRERILVADHLVLSLHSVQVNLIDARLHFLGALDSWEREQSFRARSVVVGRSGLPEVNLPKITSAHDELAEHQAQLHVVGLFRAAGSALDCLGAAMAIILALPIDVQRKATLQSVRNSLKRKEPWNTEASAFRGSFEQTIMKAGPAGWLDWALDYRNLLVHRARRTELVLIEPTSHVLGPDGRPVARANLRRQLARQPELSDIEAFTRMRTTPPVLTEDAESTLNGLLESLGFTIAEASRSLLGVWRRRRASPGSIPQPAEKWERVAPSTETTPFSGYNPGTVPFRVTQITMPQAGLTRLRAADLKAQGSTQGVWDDPEE